MEWDLSLVISVCALCSLIQQICVKQINLKKSYKLH